MTPEFKEPYNWSEESYLNFTTEQYEIFKTYKNKHGEQSLLLLAAAVRGDLSIAEHACSEKYAYKMSSLYLSLALMQAAKHNHINIFRLIEKTFRPKNTEKWKNESPRSGEKCSYNLNDLGYSALEALQNKQYAFADYIYRKYSIHFDKQVEGRTFWKPAFSKYGLFEKHGKPNNTATPSLLYTSKNDRKN